MFLVHDSGATLTTLKKKMFASRTIWVSKKVRKVWGVQISKKFFSNCFQSLFWCVWVGSDTDTLKKKMFADRAIWVSKWGRKDWWVSLNVQEYFQLLFSCLHFSVPMTWGPTLMHSENMFGDRATWYQTGVGKSGKFKCTRIFWLTALGYKCFGAWLGNDSDALRKNVCI